MIFLKTCLRAFLFLAMLLILSCASPIGKRMPPGHGTYISPLNGHHLVQLTHLNLNYDYIVNSEGGNITLNGEIQFHDGSYASEWDVDKIAFSVYFLDSNSIIVGRDSFVVYQRSGIYLKNIPLKKKLKYDSQYMYVVYGYKVNLRL